MIYAHDKNLLFSLKEDTIRRRKLITHDVKASMNRPGYSGDRFV